MATILMVYASVEGQARSIVERAAELARAAGHEVRIAAAEELLGRRPAVDPDAILFAASIHFGRHSDVAVNFVESSRALLERVPTAFVSVSLSAGTPGQKQEAVQYVEDFMAATGWRPSIAATVAGALRFSRYGFIKRRMMTRIAGEAGLASARYHGRGGGETGAGARRPADVELTDWAAVEHVVDGLLERVEPAGVA